MSSLMSRVARVLLGAALVPTAAFAQAPAASAAPPFEYVRFTTTLGPFVLELNREKAPISVENFLKYVDKGHYDGTIFHRVIPSFMIQGGGYGPDLVEKPTEAPIKNEWKNGLRNERGTVAMARTPQPDSATSQFFINVVDNAFLDAPRDGAAYAVFGKVLQGMDIVDKIKGVATERKDSFEALPKEAVVISSVKRVPASEMTDAIAEARKAEEEAKTKPKKDGIQLVKSKGVDVERGVTTPSGLWYADSVVGTGEAPPSPSSRVKVHYRGWLTNGTEFDSSYKTNQPASFALNGVIKGWTEGVGGMKVGGKRFLVIPPDMGYGASGRPPIIPGNSTLVFEVELLEIIAK